LSSTTDRRPERGQILVLFAGGIATLLIVAALAFDVGMMLVERRDQQNAADAAALAGARHSLESGSYSGLCENAPSGNDAAEAACDLARVNGFDSSLGDENVRVHIPPLHGQYRGMPGFVEVQIEATRPSIFGGIIGRAMWPVGAYAVAANQPNLTFPFSMLALSPSGCKAMLFSGAGVVEAYGNIHSNSTGSECTGDPVSLSRTGGATVNIYADDATCRAAGLIQDQGSGSMTCSRAENSFVLPDPLRRLAAPAKPALAPAVVPVGHARAAPDWCPGATGSRAPRENQTQPCDIGGNGGSYRGLSWILSPGLYPAGLRFTNEVTAYLLPGIYWIGGGGFQTAGSASVITVSGAGVVPTTTASGGVMIYNSKLPGSAGGAVSLGGTGATLRLKPLDVGETDPDRIYNDIVIFQDRTVTAGVTLNGSASVAEVEGLIYVPAGLVTLNGNGGTLLVDQIIADSYKVNGDNGTLKVLRRTGVDAVISGAGLVE
jgi:hypothetical protein